MSNHFITRNVQLLHPLNTVKFHNKVTTRTQCHKQILAKD